MMKLNTKDRLPFPCHNMVGMEDLLAVYDQEGWIFFDKRKVRHNKKSEDMMK